MGMTGRQRTLAGIGLGAVAGALALVLACSPVADKSAEQQVTGAAATASTAATSPVAATGMVTPTAEEQAAAASSVVFGQLPDVTTAATATGLVLIAGIVLLGSGLFTLLLGIFSVRASNDFSKIGPAYVLAIIDLAISVIGIIVNFVGTMNVSSLLEGVVGIPFAACIFWAAKTIKDNA